MLYIIVFVVGGFFLCLLFFIHFSDTLPSLTMASTYLEFINLSLKISQKRIHRI